MIFSNDVFFWGGGIPLTKWCCNARFW